MPSLRFSTTIAAAGGVVPNLLTGTKFEFLPQAAAVTVYSVSSVAGVDLEGSAGNVVETDSLEVPLQPGAGTGPDTQNHRVAAFVGAPGDRLTIKLSNRAGGAGVVVRTLVEIRPL